MWGKKFLVACGLVAATSGVVSCNESKENKDEAQKENTEDVRRTDIWSAEKLKALYDAYKDGMENLGAEFDQVTLKGKGLEIGKGGFTYTNDGEHLKILGFFDENGDVSRVAFKSDGKLFMNIGWTYPVLNVSSSSQEIVLVFQKLENGKLLEYMPAEYQHDGSTPVKQTGSRTASFSRGER